MIVKIAENLEDTEVATLFQVQNGEKLNESVYK